MLLLKHTITDERFLELDDNTQSGSGWAHSAGAEMTAHVSSRVRNFPDKHAVKTIIAKNAV